MDANFLICSLLALEQYCPLKGIDTSPWGKWKLGTIHLHFKKGIYCTETSFKSIRIYLYKPVLELSFTCRHPVWLVEIFLYPIEWIYDLAMRFALFFYCYLTKQVRWNRLCQGVAIMSCVKKKYIWFETTTL